MFSLNLECHSDQEIEPVIFQDTLDVGEIRTLGRGEIADYCLPTDPFLQFARREFSIKATDEGLEFDHYHPVRRCVVNGDSPGSRRMDCVRLGPGEHVIQIAPYEIRLRIGRI